MRLFSFVPGKTRPAWGKFSALLILSLLSGCSLAPEYIRPEAPVPDFLGSPEEPALAPASGIGWRDFFADPGLRELIAASLIHNRDLKTAALAVAEAQALYGVENAERFPQAETGAENNMTGGFDGRSSRNNYQIALMPSFELDFFGRLRNLGEAALQEYLATEEAEKSVRISLISQVAQSYFALLLAREQLQLAENTFKSRSQSYAFIESRVQSGQSSLLDLEQARSQVEAAQAETAMRRREVVQTANALQLLSGSFSGKAAPSLEPVPLAEQTLARLPAGIASSVLLTRPDVMAAEHRLLGSHANIGAARAAFFPSISLTGNLGYMSGDLSGLFSESSAFWSFVPKISLPIFSGGRLSANLELAEIRREAAVVQYEKAIQTAFREVADALLSQASFADQIAAQERYLASQRLVSDLATDRYANGAASYLEVLDAQRSILQAEQNLLNIRRDQLMNAVNLYSALGGGLISSDLEQDPAAGDQ
ncbi:MAG: efflux transporter outer membrane subunit [Desulfarculales bacterium]|jgi:Cu(I)/Ag(I) efflux system outer membrane protein|nr:efflux transporter outer membrane subunit [Desulfarculales bacterium]